MKTRRVKKREKTWVFCEKCGAILALEEVRTHNWGSLYPRCDGWLRKMTEAEFLEKVKRGKNEARKTV